MLGLDMSGHVELVGGASYTQLTAGDNTRQYHGGCYVTSNNNNNNNNNDVDYSNHDNKNSLCDIVSSGMESYQQEEHLQSQTSHQVEPGVCAACSGKIIDRYYLLAVDRKWHVTCLRCVECKLPLDSEVTCFAKDGNIYCKEDYYRLFGLKRCARCQLTIGSRELVMKARDFVYHINCFTCVTCQRLLTTGEHFGMYQSLVYCKTHYHSDVIQADYKPIYTDTTPSGHVTYYNGVGAVQKGRPRKRKSPLPEIDFHGHNLALGNDDIVHVGPDGLPLQTPRQKRMRTSFKHHQLRIMKSYFTLNHNPDAKDLKQLAQKTGLNKRVLQVWFQNARAKYRRNVLKSEGDKAVSQEGSQSAGDEGKVQRSSGSGMSDISGARSPALSDVSSSASLSDYHNTSLTDETGSEQKLGAHITGSSGLMSELFGDTGVGSIMHK